MSNWKSVLPTLLVLCVLGVTATDALAKKRSNYYTVKDGDTLSGIAANHGCTAQDILRFNKKKIPNPDVITKGLRLFLPKKCRKRRAMTSSPSSPVEDMVSGIKWTPNGQFCKTLKKKLKPNPKFKRRYYRGKCGSYAECKKRHRAFTNFRTKNYGYFPGFGDKTLNPNNPAHYSQWIEFMGKRVRINQLVIHPLKCAERAVTKHCRKCKEDPDYPNECEVKKKWFPYKPRVVSGLRHRNTFRGGEVSNHVYGIAIDFDPAHNTCCGCVGKWKRHTKCRNRKLKTYERMRMPMCWVEEFKKYGFYWLGEDTLKDTMHFEFLGDPDVIRRTVRTYRNK